MAAIGAGYALLVALMMRTREAAVLGIEHRDGVKFYVVPNSALRRSSWCGRRVCAATGCTRTEAESKRPAEAGRLQSLGKPGESRAPDIAVDQ